MVAPENSDADCFEVEADYFADCADKINEKIIEDIKSDETAAERGLAFGFVNAALESKIISAFPAVENCGGELYGVVTVKHSGELSVEEMGKLKGVRYEKYGNHRA
ncbi:MAG: hypothetical protein NC299_15360 [Lachnospiraceae bacterium]|nr:hypothetical protein [Ruminococcus sp.]MCM1276712.1 hypothetical protein [Lachnospiraceae bacterium]